MRDSIINLLRLLERTGLLAGYIEKIRVTALGSGEDIYVEECNDARVPEEWSGYGFEWGIGNGKAKMGEVS